MSTEPERSEQRDDEVINLNSDDLDVQELDEKLLEEVAGGMEPEVTCVNFFC
jgi:hypothetical protein